MYKYYFLTLSIGKGHDVEKGKDRFWNTGFLKYQDVYKVNNRVQFWL